jgi:hypothetical protein
MQAQPGRDGLIEDELGILVPATGQRHDEGPGAPQPIVLGIPEQAAVPEVHLGFRAGIDLEAQGGPRRRRRHAAQEPLDRRIAAAEAVLLHQQLPDRLALDALGVPGEHLLAEGLDERLLLGRPRAGGAASKAANTPGSGKGPVSSPCWVAHRW